MIQGKGAMLLTDKGFVSMACATITLAPMKFDAQYEETDKERCKKIEVKRSVS